MDAETLRLILLARIAGETDPDKYVNDNLAGSVDPKAVASRNVRVYMENVDLGHKDDQGEGYLTPVVKRETTVKLVDGTEAVTVA